MMMDWNAYQAQVQAGVAGIGRASVGIVRGYRELSDAPRRQACALYGDRVRSSE